MKRKPESKVTHDARNKRLNPLHNKVSSLAYKRAGGEKAFYELPKDERLNLRADAMSEVVSQPVGDWMAIQSATVPKKPRKNPITRMRQWVGGKMEGEVVPEGWVYAIQNVEVPHLLKIGRTYPEGLEGRLAEAQRWGRYEIVGQYWFDDVNHAEKCIHAKLAKWNLRNQGITDVGTEVFNVSIENFQRAAADHMSDLIGSENVAA